MPDNHPVPAVLHQADPLRGIHAGHQQRHEQCVSSQMIPHVLLEPVQRIAL